MHIIGWIIFGLLVGIIARFVLPGPHPMGMIMSTLLGVAGSFVGGMIANLLQGGSLTDPRASGWIGSVIGAVLLLLIYSLMSRKSEV
jgi:uncharacterized membrane protein YeaQ/YmgE (transglycosylase-associated protein family)